MHVTFKELNIYRVNDVDIVFNHTPQSTDMFKSPVLLYFTMFMMK